MPGPVTGSTPTVPSVTVRGGDEVSTNPSAIRPRTSAPGTTDTFSREGAGQTGSTFAIARPASPPRDNLRTYAELSARQQRLLGPEGQQVYERLRPRNKAAFIVLTTRMDNNGVDYSGMRLKEGGRGIHVDRLLLEQDPADPGGLARFRRSIEAGGRRWIHDKPRGHHGMDEWGVRENRTRESMQIGIGREGAFVDIDRFNYRKPLGFFGHVLELVTPGKTDIFKVARALHIDLYTRTAPPVATTDPPPRDIGL